MNIEERAALRRTDRRCDGGGRRHRRQGHTPHFQGIAAKLSGKVRCYHLQGSEGDRERRTAVPVPGVRPQRCSGTGRGAEKKGCKILKRSKQ